MGVSKSVLHVDGQPIMLLVITTFNNTCTYELEIGTIANSRCKVDMPNSVPSFD